MSKPGEFAVLGLGRFGRAVALSLIREGQAVLAVDINPERIEMMADQADAVVSADTTDEASLSGLRLERMSCVVVAIGPKSTEASILTTALLRQVGVPRIIARAFNELHARVLVAVGAHEVINPEDEMGRRLARRLAHPAIVDQLELGDATIAEIEAPETFVGQDLAALDLRNRYRISVLGLRRQGVTRSNPRAQDRIESGDVLLVMGQPAAIERVAALV